MAFYLNAHEFVAAGIFKDSLTAIKKKKSANWLLNELDYRVCLQYGTISNF